MYSFAFGKLDAAPMTPPEAAESCGAKPPCCGKPHITFGECYVNSYFNQNVAPAHRRKRNSYLSITSLGLDLRVPTSTTYMLARPLARRTVYFFTAHCVPRTTGITAHEEIRSYDLTTIRIF